MRTLGLVWIACGVLCGALVWSGEGLEQTVTLQCKETPVAEFLRELQSKAGLRLAWSEQLIKADERITLDAQQQPAARVLRSVLRPRGLTCIQTGPQMLAVVREDSEAGILKTFGASVRELIRLELKLEG